MFILLNRKRLEPPLVQRTLPAGVVVSVVPLGVGDRQPTHELRQIAVVCRPKQQVPMVGHQTVAQEADRLPVLGLPQDLFEGGVIAVFMKEGGAAHSPIEHVVDITTGIAAQASWHGTKLPDASVAVKRNDSRPLFFSWCSNSAAGAADKITCGGTAWIREGLGYNDAVDQNSMAYKIGGFAGQAISIGLMFANPAALANSVLGPSLTIGLNTINMMSKASSVLSMGVEASKGDFSGVAMAGLNMVPGVLRGAGSGCGSTLLQRGIQFYGMAGGAISGAAKAINGDVIGGLLDIAQAGASAYRFMQSCFAAGTKLLTKRGWVVIERLEVGDEVWSKPEEEPGAVGAWKRVEELFVRTAMLLRVQVGGQEILTTAEHPFFIRDKGWLPAGFLEVGQQVVGKDSEWTTVEATGETGKVATVYNCRIADYHTYFVGGEEWGFSVWAHNADLYHYTNDKGFKGISAGSGEGQITLKASQPVRKGNPKGVYLTSVPPDQVKSVGLGKLGLTNDKVTYYFKLSVPDELVKSLRGDRGKNVKYVPSDLTLPRSAILEQGSTGI